MNYLTLHNMRLGATSSIQPLVLQKLQTVEDLLPATLKQEAAPRARTVRVNTLLWSVEEALAWLESPPQQHAKFASQVPCRPLLPPSWTTPSSDSSPPSSHARSDVPEGSLETGDIK